MGDAGHMDQTEAQMEAARKQKIHNLKLKTACLENEEYIQELHVGDWSEHQKTKLAAAHDKAQDLLQAVETGTKWHLTRAYDLAKLMRTCGLEMSQRDLYKPEDKPQIMDVINLKKVLQELKQNRNKTRIVSFTGMIDSAIATLESVEEELRRSQLDATQLAQVPIPILKQVEDIMNVTNIRTALASTEENMKTQIVQIDKTNEIQQVAVSDGEMAVAEEQMYQKIQLQERLIQLVKDKFMIIDKVELENEPFKTVIETQKKAGQETQQMRDAKRRLKQKCETDLKRIHDAIQKADLEDAEAMKRFASLKDRSERMLRENLDQQDDCWKKIQDTERQLQKLGTVRFDEIKRRIEENDKEQKRQVEYQQFLEVVAQQKKLLELTVFNCDTAIKCTSAIEEMIQEATSAVKARFDKTCQELADLRLDVHKEHLEFFRMLFLTLGNLIYKKEKKMEEIDKQVRTTHIQLEFCIETFDANAKKHSEEKRKLYALRARTEDELGMLKEKKAKAHEEFRPTEEALLNAGVDFEHPEDEHKQEVIMRRSKIVEYRAHLAKHEEVRIAAERAEIQKSQIVQAQRVAAGPTYANPPPGMIAGQSGSSQAPLPIDQQPGSSYGG